MAAIHRAAMTTSRPWSADEIAALVAAEGSVAVARPHAFAIGRVVLDEAELLTLAVDPTCRGRGHGFACLAAFHAAVAARGAVRVHLEVAVRNAAARALYAKASYVATGLRRAYHRDAIGRTDDAVTLTRHLQDASAAPLDALLT